MNLRFAVFLVLGLLVAAVGNYSYFFMERHVVQETRYRPPFLKRFTDVWTTYEMYSYLVSAKGFQSWPLKTFRISLIIFCALILYGLVWPRPFGS